MLNLFDTTALIKGTGYAGIFSVIFAETGLLIGFFLPGDSLLFTAGFLAATGYLNIGMLLLIGFAAAVIGDTVGYFLGRKSGPAIFSKPEARFFKKEYAERAREFYRRHGGKALILGRFLPIIRTAVPVLAGVGEMHYPTFIFYNALGGAIWACGLSIFGYYFGKIIPNADRYVLPIILVIVVVSLLPSVIAFLRHRRSSHREQQQS